MFGRCRTRGFQVPPVLNFCLNFAAHMAEAYKSISHGVVLQKKDKKGGLTQWRNVGGLVKMAPLAVA